MSKNDLTSEFYVGQPNRGGRSCGHGGFNSSHGNGGRGDGRQRDGNCWGKLTYHNYSKSDHISRNYWAPGGGAENDNASGAGADTGDCSNAGDDPSGADFLRVDNASIPRPPCMNKPHKRTLPDGTRVKWCPGCGEWGDHFRAGYPAEKADKETPGELANVATG